MGTGLRPRTRSHSLLTRTLTSHRMQHPGTIRKALILPTVAALQRSRCGPQYTLSFALVTRQLYDPRMESESMSATAFTLSNNELAECGRKPLRHPPSVFSGDRIRSESVHGGHLTTRPGTRTLSPTPLFHLQSP